MDYEIVETHVIYYKAEIIFIATVWEANENGAVRGTFCTNVPCSGYRFISKGEKISDSLMQEVAGAGMNITESLKKKYFPGWKWER